MTHHPNSPERSAGEEKEVLAGPPRWVKVSVIVGGAIVLIIVVVMLLTGGQHGPARHLGTGAPPASATELQAGELHPSSLAQAEWS